MICRKVILECLIYITVISATAKGSIKGWIEPDAWSLDHSKTKNLLNSDLTKSIKSMDPINDYSKCEVKQNVNDVISEVFYRKLLALLFNKNKLKYDKSLNLYKRTFEIMLSDDDIKVLETSSDPRDWDEVASKIIFNSKSKSDPETGESIFNIKFFVLKLLNFLTNSEVRFVLIVLLVAIVIMSVHKMYNFRIITIILLAVLTYGYFHTYFDCNKKMELESLMENFDSQTNNPCVSQKSIFSLWWTSPSKQKCLEHLKNKHTTYFYCRPDDVFLIYINDIILKQFQFMVEKCLDICDNYSRKLSFPYNYIAMFAVPFLLILFLKEIFKNVLNPLNWREGFPRSHKEKEFIESPKDNLSGKNLKLFLNALQNQHKLQDENEIKGNSGVENLECLTAPVKATKFFDSTQKDTNSSKTGSKSDLTDSSVEIIENF